MKEAPEKLLTLVEVAALVGAPSTSTLRKDVAKGRLKAEKKGKTYIVAESEARRWVKKEWPKHVAARDKPIKAQPSVR